METQTHDLLNAFPWLIDLHTERSELALGVSLRRAALCWGMGWGCIRGGSRRGCDVGRGCDWGRGDCDLGRGDCDLGRGDCGLGVPGSESGA